MRPKDTPFFSLQYLFSSPFEMLKNSLVQFGLTCHSLVIIHHYIVSYLMRETSQHR